MNKVQEKCGIFGVYGDGFEAARLTYFGLYALQHRGQEASGIVSSDGQNMYVHKDIGLVAQVYRDEDIGRLKGSIAIGHNRYSTSGAKNTHVQPVVGPDLSVALAHNGNLPSTESLEVFLTQNNIAIAGLNDSELMTEAIRYYLESGLPLDKAVREAYPLFTGAFSLLVMTRDTLIAVRDQCGIRPLSYGRLDTGYIFASESCALDTVNVSMICEVDPGSMVVVNSHGINHYQIAPAKQKLDIFEFIYFSRPDSLILGKSVDQVRQNFGCQLAREYHVDADLVIGVPDSATSAAIGYAHASGTPYYPALVKNRYIGRTFIRPEQHLRESDVQMKLNVIKPIIRGKRVVVIDDSIVRGTTSRKVVQLIRKAGAKAIHFLVSSPPYKYPDFYGIDTPNQKKLIAANQSVAEICRYLTCDSLYYLSYDGMIAATELPCDVFSTPCFNGVYPIDIGPRRAEFTVPLVARRPVQRHRPVRPSRPRSTA